MNFYSGAKMQFSKMRIFPYPKKTNKLRQTKFDLFIKSSFFLNFGKVILFPLSYFDIGKIIEDEINKSNDPLFNSRKLSNMKITKSPTLSEGP